MEPKVSNCKVFSKSAHNVLFKLYLTTDIKWVKVTVRIFKAWDIFGNKIANIQIY